MYPINVVEKETKISKYLLRMWERRYAFPRPGRDAKGERVYTQDDVHKLKLIKSLMEEGYRPSKIIDQPLPDLIELHKSFADKKDDCKKDVFLLLTSPELEGEVKDALKNQQLSQVFVIHNQEDIKNLSF